MRWIHQRLPWPAPSSWTGPHWGHPALGPLPPNLSRCLLCGLPHTCSFPLSPQKPSTFFDQRSRKATAKSWQINFIDISIFTAMWYPPSHGRDDPHYLQTDRPLHYNHPAPRQSRSLPSAQTLEHDPEVAVLFFSAVCYDKKKKKKKSESKGPQIVKELIRSTGKQKAFDLWILDGWDLSSLHLSTLPAHSCTPGGHLHKDTHSTHTHTHKLEQRHAYTLSTMPRNCCKANSHPH